MAEEKKIMEDEIMQEIREIRAKHAGRFSTEEEFLEYFKQKEEESKKEGWVFVDPRKNKKSEKANQ